METTASTPAILAFDGTETPIGYAVFLNDVEERIRAAQVRAALAVNSELVLLYWSIGADILARQKEQGWGSRVTERLSLDLRREFSEQKGFSSRNLKYMRAFAESWPDESIVQQVVAITLGAQRTAPGSH